MMSTAPLGSLAEVILELHDKLISAAISRAVTRRAPVTARESGSLPVDLTVIRFRNEELSAQHIQPGNWVAVGIIKDKTSATIIEFNLSTFESREVVESLGSTYDLPKSPGDRGDGSTDLRQAAS
jgi:hypothetical protein